MLPADTKTEWYRVEITEDWAIEFLTNTGHGEFGFTVANNLSLNFVKENPDALISALLLSKAIATKNLSMNEIKELFEGLSPEIQATENGKDIKSRIEKEAKTAVGSKAPNFSAPTPGGEELSPWTQLYMNGAGLNRFH